MKVEIVKYLLNIKGSPKTTILGLLMIMVSIGISIHSYLKETTVQYEMWGFIIGTMILGVILFVANDRIK